MPKATSALESLRRAYHGYLGGGILGHRAGTTVLSNADGDSEVSVVLAQGVAERMGVALCPEVPTGQTAGALFTEYTKGFLEKAFALLTHLRPGKWEWGVGTSIAEFAQYQHLAKLEEAFAGNPELRTALGSDYIITPDIVVSRRPLSDAEINTTQAVIGPAVATHSPLRARAGDDVPLLHASVSCKWTLRSDRAQNARSEGLNLVRNRKGSLPHVVFVTMEPLPSRLASIALGTGDIDCCYHAALPELLAAAGSSGYADAAEMLKVLVEGRRLRDISDLPLDLAT